MSSRTTWTVLSSIDILMTVVAFMDTKSVTRLSMTSKVFWNRMRHNRAMWIRICRVMMMEDHLMPFTFSFKNMPIDELILHATRPARMRHTLLHNELHHVKTDPLWLKLGPCPDENTWLDQTASPRLFPGGRWILAHVLTSSLKSYLVCWDTRMSIQEDGMMFPVVYHPLEMSHGAEMRASQMYFQSGVGQCDTILLKNGSSPAIDHLTLEVVQIKWPIAAEHPPTFIQSGLVEIHNLLPFISDVALEGDLVVAYSLFDFQRAYVWNWRSGEWGALMFGSSRMKGFWLQAPYLYGILDDASGVFAFQLPSILNPTTSPPLFRHVEGSYAAIPHGIISHDFLFTEFETWNGRHSGARFIRLLPLHDDRDPFLILEIAPPGGGKELPAPPHIICQDQKLVTDNRSTFFLSPDIIVSESYRFRTGSEGFKSLSLTVRPILHGDSTTVKLETNIPGSATNELYISSDLHVNSGKFLAREELSRWKPETPLLVYLIAFE